MNPRTIALLLATLALGFALGLLISWVIAPVEYTDTDPASLRADYKSAYRLLIAAAYNTTGDLARAQTRLRLLGDADPQADLRAQAAQSDETSAIVLRRLADEWNGVPTPIALAVTPTFETLPSATATHSPTPEPPTPTAAPSNTPTPSNTPAPGETQPTATNTSILSGITTVTPVPTRTLIVLDTPIPRPTRIPSPTPGAAFRLRSADTVCDSAVKPGLLQITVRDASGAPAAGIAIQIFWGSTSEIFYTGLKPELGNGYADFVMTPGTTYTLKVLPASETVPPLEAPLCTDDNGQSYTGSLALIFQQ